MHLLLIRSWKWSWCRFFKGFFNIGKWGTCRNTAFKSQEYKYLGNQPPTTHTNWNKIQNVAIIEYKSCGLILCSPKVLYDENMCYTLTVSVALRSSLFDISRDETEVLKWVESLKTLYLGAIFLFQQSARDYCAVVLLLPWQQTRSELQTQLMRMVAGRKIPTSINANWDVFTLIYSFWGFLVCINWIKTTQQYRNDHWKFEQKWGKNEKQGRSCRTWGLNKC